MMRCPRPVTLSRWYTRWLRAVSVHCTLPRSPWRHLWEVRVCTLRCTRRCTRGGQPTISEPIDCFLVDSRYPAAASSASYMSVLPCQCIFPCVQRSTLQRDFGRAKDHRAWPVPVLLKQGVYKLRGGVRGGGALSVPRLEALRRSRNQVTAVRDVVVRSNFRHATLGVVSVGAMVGRGIADSDKFMVPWHGLRRLLSKRLLLVLVYSRITHLISHRVY